MAGLYRRGVQRSAGLPLGQVQASQGAGGAIPRGFAPKQEQEESASDKAQKMGGLLGLMGQQKPEDKSGFGLSSGVPEIDTQAAVPGADVLGGLAHANNGMSYEEVPTGFLDMLQNGWGSFMGMFGGGAGA